MANQLGESPLVLTATSATALMTSPLNVSQIIFSGYLSSTDFVEVQDQKGKTMAILSGKSDLSPVVFNNQSGLGIGPSWNGLLIPVTGTGGNPNLNSGYCQIYYI